MRTPAKKRRWRSTKKRSKDNGPRKAGCGPFFMGEAESASTANSLFGVNGKQAAQRAPPKNGCSLALLFAGQETADHRKVLLAVTRLNRLLPQLRNMLHARH